MLYPPSSLEIRLVGENSLVNTLSGEDFVDKDVDELHAYGDGIYANINLTVSGGSVNAVGNLLDNLWARLADEWSELVA